MRGHIPRERYTGGSRLDPLAYLEGTPLVQPTFAQSLVWKLKAWLGGPSYDQQWTDFILATARRAPPLLSRSQISGRRPLTPVHEGAFYAGSLTNDNDEGNGEHTMFYLAQEQSPIFARLPAEIRREIWILVLGSMCIHLVEGIMREENQGFYLYATICQSGCCFEDLGCSDDRIEICGDDSPGVAQILPLLLTCRRIYSEAIFLLYSSNYFVLSPQMTIFHLKFHWPTGRFNNITKLHACFNIEWIPMTSVYQAEDWYNAWRTIASLQFLDRLIVTMKLFIFAEDIDITAIMSYERELLDECRDVQQPSQFILVLDWPCNPENQDLYNSLHCRIVRPETNAGF